MVNITIHGNIGPLKAALLSDVKQERIAAVVALNKCAQQIVNEGVRQLTKMVKLPTRAVRSRVKLSKAYARRRQTATITTLQQPFPIDRLGPKELLRGGYAVAGRKFPHAFRAFGNSGSSAQQRLIFQRRGKERLPIDRAGIPIEAEADAVFAPLFRRYVADKLPKLFEHELARRIRR